MIVAIDGHSSCGKSTIAKALAKKMGIAYVDTGAMYRAITLYFLRHKIDINNNEDVINALDIIDVSIKSEGGQNAVYLNGENITDLIRSIEVSNFVSPVAAIPEVRKKLVAMQKAMGSVSLVMDGRDIGSVVFPAADIKFFVTADLRTRAQRRYEELKTYQSGISLAEVTQNLANRDNIDSTRENSPLVQLPEAIVIDTTFLNLEEQLDLVYQYVMQKVEL
jgi:cytidylate kinase